MANQVLGAGLGVLAIVVGVGWAWGAISRQRRHADFQATYRAMGGPIYAAVQLGCSGLLVAGGLLIIAITLLVRPH